MTRSKASTAIRRDEFNDYMWRLREELGQSMALMLAEYEREFIMPIREWANQPWWKRIFSCPKDFEIKVPIEAMEPQPETQLDDEPESEIDVFVPQLVDTQGEPLESDNLAGPDRLAEQDTLSEQDTLAE